MNLSARRSAANAGEESPQRPARALGALRRNLWMFAVVGSAFLVGLPVTRLLESYHGVVLAREGDQMYLAFEERPPRWVPLVEVAPGTVVDKERGDWAPRGVEARARDFKLMQLYQRYVSVYDATIVRIDGPVAPGGASTAVADTDKGARIRVPLWAEHLAAVAVGRRLRKLPGSWDPILLDDPEPGAPPATPTP